MLALLRQLTCCILILSFSSSIYANQAPSKAWQRNTKQPIWSSPVLTPAASIIVASDNASVTNLSASGKEIWSFSADGRIFSSPTVDSEGAIFFGTEDGIVYKLSSNGFLLWSVNIPASVNSSISLDSQGNIYFGANDGFFRSFNTLGELRWEIDVDGTSDAAAAIVNDSLIVMPTRKGELLAFDSFGSVIWRRTLGIMSSSPAVGMNSIIYVGTWDGTLHAISDSGVTEWEVQLDEKIWSSPIITADNDIIAASTSGELYSVSQSGLIQWSVSLGAYTDSSPVLSANDFIYVAQRDGKLKAFNTAGEIQWNYNLSEGVFSSPTITENGLLVVATTKGKVVALEVGDKGVANSLWPKRGQNTSNSNNPVVNVRTRLFNFEIDSLESLYKEFYANEQWRLDAREDSGSLSLTSKPTNSSNTSILSFSDRTQAGIFSFDFRLVGDTNSHLNLFINNKHVKHWLGDTNITRFTYPLKAGYNKIEWQFHSEPDEQQNSFLQIDNVAVPTKNNNIRQDMTGDGVDDFVVLSLSDRRLKMRQLDNQGYKDLGIALACGEIPFMGDVDGDGISEIWVRNMRAGTVKIYSRSGLFETTFGVFDTDIPVFADYNGDGQTDIAIRRPSTGKWFVKRETGHVEANYFGSVETDLPVQGDYDGDGLIDLAVRRAEAGHFYIKSSRSGEILRLYFGSQQSDIPVSSDFDGDGVTDVAVLRKNEDSYQWLIRESSFAGSQIKRVTFDSMPADSYPLYGDFDGNGKNDFAFYSASSHQTFYWDEFSERFVDLSLNLADGEVPLSLYLHDKLTLFSMCSDVSLQEKGSNIKMMPPPITNVEQARSVWK